eukprot:7431-Heterococcus_DN1.PRE.1
MKKSLSATSAKIQSMPNGRNPNFNLGLVFLKSRTSQITSHTGARERLQGEECCPAIILRIAAKCAVALLSSHGFCRSSSKLPFFITTLAHSLPRLLSLASHTTASM